ncbi:MAG: spore germination protein [Firmicutes bacterium]|nr:spore germination protein [Bacillota bacterium]
MILTHLCNLQSFGTPYLAPLAPWRARDMGDFIYRKSWRWMRHRPLLTARKNIVRQRGVESKEDGSR